MEPARQLVILTSLDVDRIRELRAADEFFWLDLEAPTEEQLHTMGDLFGLHELSIEDAVHFGQRPKIEEYGDHAAIVYYGVADVGGGGRRLRLMELHAFVHGSFVVTVHREPWADRDRLCRTFGLVPMGSEQLAVYRVLDGLTDSFFPLVDRIDAEIDELEQEVVADPEPEHIDQVMRLKRDLSTLRRTVAPLRDVAGAATVRLSAIPGLEEGPHDYFRDMHDHMIRIEGSLEASRLLVSDVLSVHMATVSQRQNTGIERLTVVSTIFLPLSFVVGFFGQNFDWLVRNVSTRDDFLVYGVGGMVVALLALVPVITEGLLGRVWDRAKLWEDGSAAGQRARGPSSRA